jgi:CHAD domain-containing protein
MLEREHKYDVAPGFSLPDLEKVDGVTEVDHVSEQTLEATYFDTPDHRLAAADVTLRRRTGGDDNGWHLQLPSAVDPGARHEVRVGLGRAVRTVPKRLRSTAAGLVGAQTLSPVATIRTRRVVRGLLDESGVVLAEVADDTVEARAVTAGDHDHADDETPEATTWREIEVELVAGEADLLSRLGEWLAKAGARRVARTSKVFDLLRGPTSEPVAPVRPKDPVQQLVHHRLTTQLEELRRRDPLAREDLPEGVHTMRVAVRRLRSALATCRPFLDRSVTDPLRDELGWLSDALGEARDAEVRRARLDAAIDGLVRDRPDLDWDEHRVRQVFWSSLMDRHERAVSALGEVFASDRYAELLDRLRELVADPPWTDRAGKRVRGAYRRRVQRELRRLSKRIEAANDSALTQQERAHELHQARKAAKRARYAVEPLRPIYGSTAKTLTKRLTKLQSALGEHQDTVVSRRYLLDLSRSSDPAIDPGAALMAGALIERESLAAQEYETRAIRAWDKVNRSRLPG